MILEVIELIAEGDEKPFSPDQHCPADLPAVMGMFVICAVQYGGHVGLMGT